MAGMNIGSDGRIEWYGDSVVKSVNNAKNSAIVKACLMVQTDAVLRAPVDTGNLRSSITHVATADEGKVGTNVDYAIHQEFGTRKMAAQPFLRPALDENRTKIEKELGLILGKAAEAGGK